MPLLKCPMEGCNWEYPSELGDSQSLEIIKLHFSACPKAVSVPQTSQGKAPKINRPIVDIGIDQEEWNMFIIRWNQFKIGSNIGEDCAALQLFQCATEALGKLLLQSNRFIAEGSEADLSKAMEALSVIKVSKGARRAELMKLTQGADESIRTFAARVQGKAQTCGFVTKGQCNCGETFEINYTAEVIKDVIMAGISDIEIQTSILEMEDLEQKPLNELIAAVERKERARKAYRPIDVSVVSEYKKIKYKGPSTVSKVPPPRSRKTPCPDCKRPFCAFNGKNVHPFRNCFNCKKSFPGRREIGTGSKSGKKAVAVVDTHCELGEDDILSQSSAILGHNALHIDVHRVTQRDHPRVKIQMKPFFAQAVAVSITAIADTGAQTNLWGWDDFVRAGYSKLSLQKSFVKLSAANKQNIDVVGGFRAEFFGESPNGNKVSCQAMVYVSRCVSGFFLSFSTLIDLFIVDESFPVIGSCSPSVNVESPSDDKTFHSNPVSLSVRALNLGCSTENGEEEPCVCPQRSAVPRKPSCLPFSPQPKNIEKMKKWLLNRYASSTFNTCPHYNKWRVSLWRSMSMILPSHVLAISRVLFHGIGKKGLETILNGMKLSVS